MLTNALPIEAIRRCYAEEVRFAASLRSDALAEAFAVVPREDYAGPGPWQIQKHGGYVPTETADPRELYHDALFAIDPERHLNNGHPSSLAAWIDLLDLRPGNRVFHVGCGTGYYTAIMAEVVTPSGHVTAVEIDPDLAKRAAANLAHFAHVTVACADGNTYDPGSVDAILVNAGVTHPQPSWLGHLVDGGRLIVPLTVVNPDLPRIGSGQMLLVHRLADKYRASFVSSVGIYSSPRGRDANSNRVLARRFQETSTGKRPKVQSVRLDAHAAANDCWLHLPGVCLSSLASS
jgi:protein-L-isoaspartate(D-aspartate) O-methyltransferase